MIKIQTPLDTKIITRLRVGDSVEISGTIYGARDAAHKRFIEILKNNGRLPIDIENQIIYYVGPSATPPGFIVGSCGPTTSSRMDRYTIKLLEYGLKGMIGKGIRSKNVKKAIVEHNAIYFVTYGGCGAYLSRFIKKWDIAAFPELGPEAVYKIEVEKFPAIVGIDVKGNDIYF